MATGDASLSAEPWGDPRLRAGMEELLAARERALAGGATPRGWKVAFGAPAALAATGLEGPAVGFLTAATALGAGEDCPVGGWKAPKLEPEIAIHLGAPLGAGAGPEEARAAIAGISAAIELADVDVPPERLEEALAGNLYHRAFALAAEGPVAPLPDDPIAVEVQRDGAPLAATGDAEAATGPLAELTAYVARYLAAFGHGLSPGEVVIGGSTVPPIDVAPGQEVRASVAGAGSVAVRLAGAGGGGGR